MNRLVILRAWGCLLVGVVVLLVCAVIDARDASGDWRGGFAYVGAVPEWKDVVPFVAAEAETDGDMPLGVSHRVLFIEFDDAEWESILAEGRLPEPGAREALAGALYGPAEFSVAGEPYTVTGRIRRDVPSLSAVYVVPYMDSAAESLLANANAQQGFYDRVARDRWASEDFEPPDDLEPLLVHDAVPMMAGLPLVLLAGLALALYGAAVLQWSLVLRLHGWVGAFDGLVRAQRDHPVLFRSMFILNYATFIVVMLNGVSMPLLNLAASQWVFEIFSEGQLKELGAAYMSGNIPLAAWETFRNNFIVQTFLMSTLPSIVVPFFGVGKTLLSLIVVGFAMAPIWSGSAGSMTYHWITIAVEVQAYIIVSCGICVYTVEVAQAFVRVLRGAGEGEAPSFWAEFRTAFEPLASATMYACAALAVASIYEAVTLIAFGSSIVG